MLYSLISCSRSNSDSFLSCSDFYVGDSYINQFLCLINIISVYICLSVCLCLITVKSCTDRAQICCGTSHDACSEFQNVHKIKIFVQFGICAKKILWSLRTFLFLFNVNVNINKEKMFTIKIDYVHEAPCMPSVIKNWFRFSRKIKDLTN